VALSRYVSFVFALAVIGTLVALIQPAQVAELWSPSGARTRIPDPPPLPCKMQSWYNADRVCLSWTAPRIESR
jgi:hypothetical protein